MLVLLLQALGGAIQPLGTALLTGAWQHIVKGKPGVWLNWSVRFAQSVTLRMFWNLGLVLLMTQRGQNTSLNYLFGTRSSGRVAAMFVVAGLLWLGLGILFQDKAVEPTIKLLPRLVEQ